MPNRVFDSHDNNSFLELADEVIQVPRKEDIEIKDPDIYMKRLREISSPSQQMKEYLLSVLFISKSDPTLEGRWTRSMMITGLLGGWLAGGIKDMKYHHEEYVRLHNASVFDHHYRAKRHKWDTYVFNVIRRGMPMGVKASIVCFSAGIISFASVTYRSRLYYPDWAVGYSILGALSRSWLGLRGLVGGSGLGLLGGTIGYVVARGCEMAANKTVTQLRYEEEVEYARRRQATRDRLQRERQDWVKEKQA